MKMLKKVVTLKPQGFLLKGKIKEGNKGTRSSKKKGFLRA